MAASEIKLSSPAPMLKGSPLQLCQEGVDGEGANIMERTLGVNGATQNNIAVFVSCLLLPFSPQATFLSAFPTCISIPGFENSI
jgi:hypothetical protein